MTRLKKYIFLSSILMLILCAFIGFGLKPLIVKADELEDTNLEVLDTTQSENSGNATPYGIYTRITLSLDGGNGEMWATAKNKLTIFPATVKVVVELYSSYTYQESYTNMTLVCKNNIDDLDMNSSIEARSSTNGEQKYWKARVYYKVDSNDWQELVTDTGLFDANGVYVM